MKKHRLYAPARGPDSNRLDLLPNDVRSLVEAECRQVSGNIRPCVESNHACYRCQDNARATLEAALTQHGATK